MNYETGIIEVDYDFIDIGIPRWFIEEWWPPELVLPGWNMNRFDYVPNEGAFKLIDALGEPPKRGMYRELFKLEKRNALGMSFYRQPDEESMNWVRRAYYLKMKARQLHAADKPTPAYLLEREIAAAYSRQDDAALKQREELKDRFKSSIAPHIHRLMTGKPNAAGGGNRSFGSGPKSKPGSMNPSATTDHLNFTKGDFSNAYIVPPRTGRVDYNPKPLIVVP